MRVSSFYKVLTCLLAICVLNGFLSFLSSNVTGIQDQSLRLANQPREMKKFHRAEYDLIVMVPSVVEWKDRREYLRRQFQRSQTLTSAKVLLLFILSDEEKLNAISEAHEHLDLVFVPCKDSDQRAMPEENSSTTCKVLRGIQHITNHFTFAFLARVGDDAYFRYDHFWNSIRPSLPEGPIYMGRFNQDENVWEQHLQSHLWLKTYPPYASGMGYIFSEEAAYYIGKASQLIEFRTGYPEDAVVALWLIGTRTLRIHSANFHNHLGGGPYKTKNCTSDSILIHYMNPSLWNAIDEKGELLC